VVEKYGNHMGQDLESMPDEAEAQISVFETFNGYCRCMRLSVVTMPNNSSCQHPPLHLLQTAGFNSSSNRAQYRSILTVCPKFW
jgi:hypothetical protein